MSDLLEIVTKNVHNLRSKSGNKYKGKPHKILMGALYKKGLFDIQDDYVYVN